MRSMFASLTFLSFTKLDILFDKFDNLVPPLLLKQNISSLNFFEEVPNFPIWPTYIVGCPWHFKDNEDIITKLK